MIDGKTGSEDKQNGSPGKKKPLCLWSALVCIFSLIAVGLYIAMLELRLKALMPVWIILSIASVFLPAVAKRIRISRDQSGRKLEILAVIAGGFAFYTVIFMHTEIPLTVGYTGLIAGGLIYKFAAKENK